jgi:opacity protein-like surface antigen
MRKLLVVLLIVVCSKDLLAQKKELPISLDLYGGYTFQDRVDLGYYNNYNNYGYIRANGQYGAGLEFFVNPLRSIELSYQYMGTKAPFYDWEGQTNKNNEDGSLQYILIGGNNYMDNGGKVVPYGGAGIGVGIANFHYADNQGSTSLTKFAWNLHLGVKIRTESAVAIKLQAYLQSIVEGVGVGVGFGTGGAGAGVTTYSTMLQFGLGGALCFDLGHKGKKK